MSSLALEENNRQINRMFRPNIIRYIDHSASPRLRPNRLHWINGDGR